jgi:three-Cys-motif partner protein
MCAEFVDPEDGFPALPSGAWAVTEKHRRLRQYIDASRAARRKFPTSSFVDLYCGPGRVYVEDSGSFENGSPLIAWEESVKGATPFSKVFVADIDRKYSVACNRRLELRGAPVRNAVGAAAETARWASSQMDPSGLHLVFLDPFNLGALPFDVFRSFFFLRSVDFIVHVSANDLQRNLDSYLASDDSVMDAFAPGWRDRVTMGARNSMRGTAFEYWLSLFKREGFDGAKAQPLIRGPNNQPLYWLVAISRHPLAGKLWNDVAGKSPQGKFNFS